MTLDFAAAVAAIAEDQVARALDRDVIWVDGPDARTYLQGQLTQDVEPLAAGDVVESLVLSPQGKIDGYVRVLRVSEERFGVEIEVGYGEAVLERLRRFKIRVKATLELATTRLVEVRGPRALPPAAAGDRGVFVLRYQFGSLSGYDLLGDGAVVPPGVDLGDDAAFELSRISAGVPRMGSELTEKTIPAEAGLVERTVSFTKGCYTGQELVARLDARGNRVPWNLRELRIDGQLATDEEVALTSGGAQVGRVTSAVYVPDEHVTVALGYLKRDFAVPGEAEVELADRTAIARVAALPGGGT